MMMTFFMHFSLVPIAGIGDRHVSDASMLNFAAPVYVVQQRVLLTVQRVLSSGRTLSGVEGPVVDLNRPLNSS
jgi:hypothetical protein